MLAYICIVAKGLSIDVTNFINPHLYMGKMGKYLSGTYDGNDKFGEQWTLENMEGWWV